MGIGRSAVADSGMVSPSHQITIQVVNATSAHAGGERFPGGGISRIRTASAGPRRRGMSRNEVLGSVGLGAPVFVGMWSQVR